MSSSSEQEFTAQESVRLPPDEAFRLFTERVDAWYEINRYSVLNPQKTSSVKIEGHVGGRFMEVPMDASNPGGVLGMIHVWEPPHRFAFVDLNDCQVEVTFEAVEELTLVTISVRLLRVLSCDQVSAIKRYGWHTLLGKYKTVIDQSNE